MRGLAGKALSRPTTGPGQFGGSATAEVPARGGQRELQVVQAGGWKDCPAGRRDGDNRANGKFGGSSRSERHDLSAGHAHSFRRLEYRTRFARGQRNSATAL